MSDMPEDHPAWPGHDGGRSDLTDLAARTRADSERWFTQLHSNPDPAALTIAYTLGLAGEVGEVANIVKKLNRNGSLGGTTPDDLAEELADVFAYLILLADELGVDLVVELDRKREKNDRRWGVAALTGEDDHADR